MGAANTWQDGVRAQRRVRGVGTRGRGSLSDLAVRAQLRSRPRTPGGFGPAASVWAGLVTPPTPHPTPRRPFGTPLRRPVSSLMVAPSSNSFLD